MFYVCWLPALVLTCARVLLCYGFGVNSQSAGNLIFSFFTKEADLSSTEFDTKSVMFSPPICVEMICARRSDFGRMDVVCFPSASRLAVFLLSVFMCVSTDICL